MKSRAKLLVFITSSGTLRNSSRRPATQSFSELGHTLFCHATPRDDTECFTRVTAEDRLTSVFGTVNASVVVCGHTHMQFERTIAGRLVVNAGSVGMPFAAPRRAYWLLAGLGIQLRRTDYDFEEATATFGPRHGRRLWLCATSSTDRQRASRSRCSQAQS